jgi:hypothetical protein
MWCYVTDPLHPLNVVAGFAIDAGIEMDDAIRFLEIFSDLNPAALDD